MLAGVVSMPSNIFASTGTNVSILFIDTASEADVVLIDASNLGEKIQEGTNQKTLLSPADEAQIIDTFNDKEAVDHFSVVVSYEDIQTKGYALSAGQYFEVKIEHVDITADEFTHRISDFSQNLADMFGQSRTLEAEIDRNLRGLQCD